MSETYKDRGFITKYGSSPYDMIECTHVRLTLWIDYPTLTVKTMNEVFFKITSDKDKYKFWDAYRDDYEESTPFKFTNEYCSEPMKFNVVFYIKGDGTLAGYTQFSESQVTDFMNELWIYTSFKYGAQSSSLVLSNSLETHIYENLFDNLDDLNTGKDTYYPTHKTIESTYIDTHQRFTNFIDHIVSDSNYSVITSNSILSSSFNSRMSILSPFLPYKNFMIGVYKDDLVACNWSEYLFSVTSLTKLNEKKNPLVYYSGNIRIPSSSGGMGLIDYDISRLTPDYIVCSLSMDPSKEVVLVSLEDKEIRSKFHYEDFIHDYYSYRSGYLVNNTVAEQLLFRDRVESDELFKKACSSVVNNTIPGQLVDVQGNWCKFKVGDLFHYCNLEGKVVSNSNLMVLNDKCLFDQDDENLYFYFTYNNSYVATKGLDYPEEYKYLIYEVPRSDVRNNLISSLRKNAVRYESLPTIVATYCGMMFYKENDKLKIL